MDAASVTFDVTLGKSLPSPVIASHCLEITLHVINLKQHESQMVSPFQTTFTVVFQSQTETTCLTVMRVLGFSQRYI